MKQPQPSQPSLSSSTIERLNNYFKPLLIEISRQPLSYQMSNSSKMKNVFEIKQSFGIRQILISFYFISAFHPLNRFIKHSEFYTN